MSEKWWDRVSKADTALSILQWGATAAAFAGVSVVGTFGVIWASVDPYLSGGSKLVWYGIGVIGAFMAGVTYWLIFSAMLKQAEARYYGTLTMPKSGINPLHDVFTDQIINVEDLRLPGTQVHLRKHFRRCKFVGPNALVIYGGEYAHSDFGHHGDMIALPPDTSLVGLIVLLDCHVENCEFVRVSIFTNQDTGKALAAAGAPVKGLIK